MRGRGGAKGLPLPLVIPRSKWTTGFLQFPKYRDSSPLCGDGNDKKLRNHAAFLWQHLADTFNLCADTPQLFFDTFITAIDVVDAIDDRLTISNQCGKHERCGGAQIAAQDGRGTERGLSLHGCVTPIDLDVGTH